MAVLFRRNGTMYSVTSDEAMDLHAKLPVGTYSVRRSMMGYYLETAENLTVEGRLYGNIQRTCARILNTYNDRTRSTGVLLAGLKGSGKTLLARLISQTAREGGIITILVENPYNGDDFNTFLNSISQPTIVLFDEFEKTYNKNDKESGQTSLLSLFDGLYASKKLYLLTVNDRWGLDTNFHNRMGRLYYAIDFKGLDEDFIREYCADRLKFPNRLDSIVRASRLFEAFSFDLLQGIVEEINRYDEDVIDLLEFINAKPELKARENFRLVLTQPKDDTTKYTRFTKTWTGQPLEQVVIWVSEDVEDDQDDNSDEIIFSPSDLIKYDGPKGEYHFRNPDGWEAILTRITSGTPDIRKLL